jgi:molybdopterin synthase catalytic subunit
MRNSADERDSSAAQAGSLDSGSAIGKVRIAKVDDQALDVGAHAAAVRDLGAGADVIFCGVVRDHDHGREVVELEYSSHPTAQQILEEVAAGIAADDGVLAIAVSHRIGVLAVGEVALVAAVTAAHRKEAFENCARLVDEVKARLPIWKRQVFGDGTDEWVNCP